MQDSQQRQETGQDLGGGEQQWLARSDPNAQPERGKWGWGNWVVCKLQRALS